MPGTVGKRRGLPSSPNYQFEHPARSLFLRHRSSGGREARWGNLRFRRRAALPVVVRLRLAGTGSLQLGSVALKRRWA